MLQIPRTIVSNPKAFVNRSIPMNSTKTMVVSEIQAAKTIKKLTLHENHTIDIYISGCCGFSLTKTQAKDCGEQTHEGVGDEELIKNANNSSAEQSNVV